MPNAPMDLRTALEQMQEALSAARAAETTLTNVSEEAAVGRVYAIIRLLHAEILWLYKRIEETEKEIRQ